jgi:energy-coupling factor transporter ATP-binding protein EcfA2
MDLEKIDLDILKAITSNRKYALDFMQTGSEKLLHPDLWRFTKIITDYTRIYKEVPTRKVLLEQAGKNESLASYLTKNLDRLEPIQYDPKEFNYDIGKLKKRYQRNLLNRLKGELDKEDNDDKKLGLLRSSLTSIREADTQQVYAKNTLKDGIDNFVERFKFRKANPDLSRGTYTGFTSLDFITSGLKTPEYVLCCGSSGAGKSTLLMSLAVNMYLQNNSIDNDKFFGEGNSVIYYSLEIPYEECYDKLISSLSKIPLKTLKSTNLTDDEQIRLNKTLKFIKNYPYEFLIVDIPKGATAAQMEGIYADFNERQGKSEERTKIVVVDYIGLLDSDEKDVDQDWLKQTAISEQLYKFCRVNDLILLTGVQLNEPGPSKGGGDIGVHRLARAKSIINPSTLCLMLEKRPDEENYPSMNCHIIKSRRSGLGKFSLRKSFEICSFLNDQGFTEETANPEDISEILEKFEDEKENE